MRLIDAHAYIEKNECCGYLDKISVKKFNEITPTVDAVEVVRCKYCTFCNDPPRWENVKFDDHIKFCYRTQDPFVVSDDWYCGSGVSKNDLAIGS